jgi:hypothetical protein
VLASASACRVGTELLYRKGPLFLWIIEEPRLIMIGASNKLTISDWLSKGSRVDIISTIQSKYFRR